MTWLDLGDGEDGWRVCRGAGVSRCGWCAVTSAGAGGGSGVRCFGSTVPRGQNPEDTQYSKLKIS